MLDASVKHNLIKTENLGYPKTHYKGCQRALSFFLHCCLFVLHKRVITEEFDFIKRSVTVLFYLK